MEVRFLIMFHARSNHRLPHGQKGHGDLHLVGLLVAREGTARFRVGCWFWSVLLSASFLLWGRKRSRCAF